jgi:hypothetical protein
MQWILLVTAKVTTKNWELGMPEFTLQQTQTIIIPPQSTENIEIYALDLMYTSGVMEL